MSKPTTLYDKIWNDHLVHEAEDGTCLIYIDRHLVHEVTSPQAFEGLRRSHLMDEMAVDIDQAGAVGGLVHQMVIPDFVVQRGRFGHERQPQKKNCVGRISDGAQATKSRRGCSAPRSQ